MFVFNDDVLSEPCEPGVTRKVLTYSDELMMVEVKFEKGARGNEHNHPHLQITYVAEGSFEFTVAGDTKVVKKGDSIYIPSDALHSVIALEESMLVDVFNPMRETFVQ